MDHVCHLSLLAIELFKQLFTAYYNFYSEPAGVFNNEGMIIPVLLSTLPFLKRCTIRAALSYDYCPGFPLWKFFSPISLITPMFSSSAFPSHLKHVTLDFDCSVLPSQSKVVSECFLIPGVIRSPLARLLSSIFSFSTSIHVDLSLRSGYSQAASELVRVLLFHISDCAELMQFEEQGMLSIKPLLPTT